MAVGTGGVLTVHPVEPEGRARHGAAGHAGLLYHQVGVVLFLQGGPFADVLAQLLGQFPVLKVAGSWR